MKHAVDTARTADAIARVRIDKWLWAARFYRTRSLAAQAIETGHVRVDGERVDAFGQLARQGLVDHAVALDAALPFEGFSHDIESEMGLPARPVPGMAFMLVGFIDHPQALGGESRG